MNSNVTIKSKATFLLSLITCGLWLTLGFSLTMLTGCNWLHGHQTDYRNSKETRPLEVPPDLDTPSASGALIIPEHNDNKAGPNTATASSAPSGAPPEVAPSMLVTLGGDGIHVTDSVESTWSRVGLALDHSGTLTVLNRDEAGKAFDIQTTVETKVSRGWFKRMITLGKSKSIVTPVRLTVHITADGEGSKVMLEGPGGSTGEQAAKAVLEILRQRLS